MTCFFCKGNMEHSTTTHMVDLGRCIVIVKNVPCMKCTQCGEVIYTGAVVKRLETILSTLEDTLTEIAVVNYDKVA